MARQVGWLPSVRPARRAVGLTDRDGAAEPDDRAVGDGEQFVIRLDDLYPVVVFDGVGGGVQRGNPCVEQPAGAWILTAALPPVSVGLGEQ